MVNNKITFTFFTGALLACLGHSVDASTIATYRYGFENTTTATTVVAPTYIRYTYAFAQRNDAVQFYEQLRATTEPNISIQLMPRGGGYVVTLGPISKAAKTRQEARLLQLQAIKRSAKVAAADESFHEQKEESAQKNTEATIAARIARKIEAVKIAKLMSPFDHLSKVISLSVGAAWNQSFRAKTFFIQPEMERTYTANQSSNGFTTGDLFLGLQKEFSSQLFGQLGVSLTTGNQVRLSGDMWDDASPELNNHRYSYKVEHSHLALKGKWLVNSGHWVVPWVSGTLGLAWNKAYAFENRASIPEALINDNFAANTVTAFTYAIGVGLQKPLTQHVQVGLGYEFANWGSNKLGPTADQTLNQSFFNSHVLVHAILFNLTLVT